MSWGNSHSGRFNLHEFFYFFLPLITFFIWEVWKLIWTLVCMRVRVFAGSRVVYLSADQILIVKERKWTKCQKRCQRRALRMGNKKHPTAAITINHNICLYLKNVYFAWKCHSQVFMCFKLCLRTVVDPYDAACLLCSLRHVTHSMLLGKYAHEHFRSTSLTTGLKLCHFLWAPYRFAFLSPANSPLLSVRADMTRPLPHVF